jgi:hypothetical protein
MRTISKRYSQKCRIEITVNYQLCFVFFLILSSKFCYSSLPYLSTVSFLGLSS